MLNKEEIELAYTVADNINLDYSKVNENRFETLCFVSNNKTLQRRK